MNYSQEITIDLPLASVIAVFEDPASMNYWRPEPVSTQHLSGEPGQPGAKSRMIYKSGKTEFSLIETITARDLPHEFSGMYEAESMTNTIKRSFTATGDNRTLYKIEVDYTFKTMVWQIIGAIMPGLLKRQTYKYMKLFKDFAEKKLNAPGIS
jgi:hypothetical protein